MNMKQGSGRDVVSRVRKGEPQTLKYYHRVCFDGNYDDPRYWTFQWFSEAWSSKPFCAACGQTIQRLLSIEQEAV